MLSKNIIKLVHSLETKKYRRKEKLFVAEGPKVVGELMRKYSPEMVIATAEWAADTKYEGKLTIVTDEELRKVSFLKAPQQVLALFPTTDSADIAPRGIADKLCIALDGVQDPGNLGTIIRVADWFGIDTILCSSETADIYNPKVVQATMGSIAHVSVIYTDLHSLLANLPADYPVYGTLLDGDNIYDRQLTKHGIIIMGNEGNGISQPIRRLVTDKLLIPSFASGDTAESLNVAIATAIVCSEFKRKSV